MRRNILTLFLLIFMISFTAQAQNRTQQERRPQMNERFEKNNDKKMDRKRGGNMDARLKLTEDQKEKIEDIRLAGKKESLPYQNEIREKKAAMRSLSTGDSYDVKGLNKLTDDISKLEASIQKVNILKRGEIRELLTEDQKIIFDSMPMHVDNMQKRRPSKKRR